MEPNYLKLFTSEEMAAEAWITAHIDSELMAELHRLTQKGMSINDIVVEALKEYVRNK